MRFSVFIAFFFALVAIAFAHVHEHHEGEDPASHHDCSVKCVYDKMPTLKGCNKETDCITKIVKDDVQPCVTSCPDTCEKKCVVEGINDQENKIDDRKNKAHACIKECHPVY
ncbi:hypothetical protein Ciccas_005807 [Cichlidogyrus casuarinus]|uniref:Uncharacterized protein n=1 Tax=Cichlidogyrus casuarinus TaxID=1844966 RepID=A0ABD2Q7W9_9PLAT